MPVSCQSSIYILFTIQYSLYEPPESGSRWSYWTVNTIIGHYVKLLERNKNRLLAGLWIYTRKCVLVHWTAFFYREMSVVNHNLSLFNAYFFCFSKLAPIITFLQTPVNSSVWTGSGDKMWIVAFKLFSPFRRDAPNTTKNHLLLEGQRGFPKRKSLPAMPEFSIRQGVAGGRS